jgi:nitrogen-specific signal transduction histidine kinase
MFLTSEQFSVCSTKGEDHCGLGLRIAHGIVNHMQPAIHCRNGTNGTSFEILLPIPRIAGQTPAARHKVQAPA